LTRFLALIPGMLGLLVLAAWGFGWADVERLGLASVTMNPTTAACFVFLSLGLIGDLFNLRGSFLKSLGRGLIVCVMVIAGLKLLDVFAGSHIGIDAILFASKLDHNGLHPSRMAPNAAICFLLIGGSAILTSRHGIWAILASQIFALTTGTIALFAVVGYIFGVPILYGVAAFIPMAVHTAASFICLATALLMTIPLRGLVAPLGDKGAAGHSARMLLPAAFIVPFGLGWLRRAGEHTGLYSSDTGVAIMVTINVLMLMVLIGWNSRLLLAVDRKRIKAEAEILRMAMHDYLTGLPNRALFMEYLTSRLASYHRHSSDMFAVFYADLDGFKQVNDRLGHSAGDDLLKQVADHLSHCMRSEDMVARLGGDEFSVLLERVASANEAEIVANRIVEGMPKFCCVDDVEVPVGISIGMVLVEGHLTPEALLRDADRALCLVKESGKGRYEFHGASRPGAAEAISA
jgi:diguanylate cyclase (GGDEF)-like protein